MKLGHPNSLAEMNQQINIKFALPCFVVCVFVSLYFMSISFFSKRSSASRLKMAKKKVKKKPWLSEWDTHTHTHPPVCPRDETKWASDKEESNGAAKNTIAHTLSLSLTHCVTVVLGRGVTQLIYRNILLWLRSARLPISSDSSGLNKLYYPLRIYSAEITFSNW